VQLQSNVALWNVRVRGLVDQVEKGSEQSGTEVGGAVGGGIGGGNIGGGNIGGGIGGGGGGGGGGGVGCLVPACWAVVEPRRSRASGRGIGGERLVGRGVFDVFGRFPVQETRMVDQHAQNCGPWRGGEFTTHVAAL